MRYKNLSVRGKLIFCLDILLFDLFVLSLSPTLTGLSLHEIIGALLFLSIIIHVSIEWHWFSKYIRRLFKPTRTRDKFNLLLNTIVFLGLIFQVVSGLVISQVLLPFFNIKTINDISWFSWHAQIALATIILIGFHLAPSLNKILSYFRKKPNSLNEKKGKLKISFKLALYRICILCLLSCVVAVLSYLIIGAPSGERIYTGDAIKEFRPNFVNGIIQLLSQIFFVIITCLIARKWFKVSP